MDTSAFLAIENRRDANHRRALTFRDESLEAGELLVTSDYVLDESYTITRRRAGHSIAESSGGPSGRAASSVWRASRLRSWIAPG